MEDLKKILAFGAALLLVVGLSADLFAQGAATPAGIRIRVTSPDSGAVVGIGGKVRVQVLRSRLFGPALDSVIVAVVTDTVRNQAVTTFNPDSNLVGSGYRASTGTSTSSVETDTFKVEFTVAAGDPSATGLAVQVYLEADTSATNSWYTLNNLSRQTETSLTGSALVGDLKRFGIDGQRPINGNVIVSAQTGIDTAAARAFPGSTTLKAYRIGEMVKLRMQVQNIGSAGINAVRMYLVDAVNSAYQSPDSARYAKTWTLNDLISGGGVVRDSFTVTEGQFQTTPVPNNMRVTAISFLVDQAGNLSANSAGAGSPQGFTASEVVVIDTKRPTVTVVYPTTSTNQDSNRFTGDTDTTVSFVRDTGVRTDSLFALRPLKFSVNEGTTERRVVLATGTDSVALFGGSSSTSTVTYTTVDSFSAPKGDVDGVSTTLRVTATDSVGNTNTPVSVRHRHGPGGADDQRPLPDLDQRAGHHDQQRHPAPDLPVQRAARHALCPVRAGGRRLGEGRGHAAVERLQPEPDQPGHHGDRG
jgi:hypothetical protein